LNPLHATYEILYLAYKHWPFSLEINWLVLGNISEINVRVPSQSDVKRETLRTRIYRRDLTMLIMRDKSFTSQLCGDRR
jgi:hypothetical protein